MCINDNAININKKIKRIIILGHSGFIGFHLIKTLRIRYPKCEIVGFSLPEVDLTKKEDVSKVADMFDVHTALIVCSGIKRQFGDTLDNFQKNCDMIINLSHYLYKRNVGRLIFFSSTAVYGEDIHNTEITEKTPIHPTSYYGLAKYTSERLLLKWSEHFPKSKLAILRPPLIYGPGDQGETYGPCKFIQTALKKEPITLWGDGTEYREFILVDDIVEIVSRLVGNQHEGVINIASGTSYSFKDVLDIVSSLCDSNLVINSRSRTKNKVDNIFHNNLFVNLFSDFSFSNIRDGIKKVFEFEKRSLDVT